MLGGASAGGVHDMESLIRGADADHLAGTFRYVFSAACLGLCLAWFFLVIMQERPLRDRRRDALEQTLEAEVPSPLVLD